MNKRGNAEETVTVCSHKKVSKCAQALMDATKAWGFQASQGTTEVTNKVYYMDKF